jgi:uncharacterized coiled-coil DUF342 family protein
MRQKASEARREAKALQQKLQTVTDSEERKVLARQMNELFAQAASLREEAKHLHYQTQSIERDFRCMETNLEDLIQLSDVTDYNKNLKNFLCG